MYQQHQILLSNSHCDGFCIDFFLFFGFESIMVSIIFMDGDDQVSFGMLMNKLLNIAMSYFSFCCHPYPWIYWLEVMVGLIIVWKEAVTLHWMLIDVCTSQSFTSPVWLSWGWFNWPPSRKTGLGNIRQDNAFYVGLVLKYSQSISFSGYLIF